MKTREVRFVLEWFVYFCEFTSGKIILFPRIGDFIAHCKVVRCYLGCLTCLVNEGNMLRRLGRSGRFVTAGILLQQNEKKEDAIERTKIQVDGRPKWESVRDFSFAGFKNFLQQKLWNSDESIRDGYKAVRENILDEHTGWDRLRDLCTFSDASENPNLQFVNTTASVGFFLGFAYGGMKEYVKKVNLFILTNDTTKFANASHAKKELARIGFGGFFKGGLLMGPKVGFLAGLFAFVQAAIAEYRGKNGIIEFPIAGGITTAVMKWNLGIRGMFSGFVSGSLTGLIMGPVVYMLLKMNGLSMTDARYTAYKIRKKREELLRESERESTIASTRFEKFYSRRTRHLPPGFPDDEIPDANVTK